MTAELSTSSSTEFWVRLPNWLGDVVMALPALRALRAELPDVTLTLVGRTGFAPLIERFDIGQRFIALPDKGLGYYRAFKRLCTPMPQHYLLFTHSLRGDMEAAMSGARRRFAAVRPGRFRPLLTDAYRVPKDTDLAQVHQTVIWQQMMRHFGWQTEFDFRPLGTAANDQDTLRIGLICGSENSPEKRWPVGHWRQLVDALLSADTNTEIVLFGTPGDREITDQVVDGFDPERVRNRAGQTNLAAFCDELAACRVVCCNDTGGMHLANMLGAPVVAIFGPTNPVRTGPIFSAPVTIIQPPDCAPTGGVPIDRVSVEQCAGAVRQALSSQDK
ncbi:MAG: glycosyltransferase family 9 protein [Pseudomonadota bacterium]